MQDHVLLLYNVLSLLKGIANFRKNILNCNIIFQRPVKTNNTCRHVFLFSVSLCVYMHVRLHKNYKQNLLLGENIKL